MIECYEILPNLCKHLHLPVQAGNDQVLRRMFRFYKIKHYKERIEKLRRVVPDVSVTTDIIVGFPGETEAQFEDTVRLLKEVRFDSIYSFKYSERSGTKAAKKFDDDIPEAEKDRRLLKLQALQDEVSQEINSQALGRVETVLVEKHSKEGRLQGRLDNNKLVHFEGDPSFIGQFTQVRLDTAFPHSFVGTLCR